MDLNDLELEANDKAVGSSYISQIFIHCALSSHHALESSKSFFQAVLRMNVSAAHELSAPLTFTANGFKSDQCHVSIENAMRPLLPWARVEKSEIKFHKSNHVTLEALVGVSKKYLQKSTMVYMQK